jgi:hypothetical protein
MADDRWLTREEVDQLGQDAMTYDKAQLAVLKGIANLLIDIRTLLGEGNKNGKAKNRG